MAIYKSVSAEYNLSDQEFPLNVRWLEVLR